MEISSHVSLLPPGHGSLCNNIEVINMSNSDFSTDKKNMGETPKGYYIAIFILPVLWLFMSNIPLIYNYMQEKDILFISVIILLFFLVFINVLYKILYGIKTSEIFASVIVTFTILFFGSSFIVSIRSTRNYGMLAGCEANISNIAVAAENYAKEYNQYPSDLNSLLKSGKNGPFLKELPQCNAKRYHYWPLPYRDKSPSYGYIISAKKDNYTIWCNGSRIHSGAGLPLGGCWPQYTPDKGLMLGTARK